VALKKMSEVPETVMARWGRKCDLYNVIVLKVMLSTSNMENMDMQLPLQLAYSSNGTSRFFLHPVSIFSDEDKITNQVSCQRASLGRNDVASCRKRLLRGYTGCHCSESVSCKLAYVAIHCLINRPPSDIIKVLWLPVTSWVQPKPLRHRDTWLSLRCSYVSYGMNPQADGTQTCNLKQDRDLTLVLLRRRDRLQVYGT